MGHWYSNDILPLDDCYPDVPAASIAGISDWDYYYYSPGFCPSGWMTAATLLTIGSPMPAGIFGSTSNPTLLDDKTSGYLCCPS
jgi:hypothetical protein